MLSRRALFAVLVVTGSLVVVAGVVGALPAGGEVREVQVVDVVPANHSNLSGVHAVEAGSTVLLRGTTDRRPEDNAIDVSVIDGPDADRFGVVVVRSWAYDGVWTARLDVPANVTPGTYTLAVRVGEERDLQNFEVVERKRAVLDSATWSDDTVRVAGVTLPDGGYVEVRDGDAVVGRSAYLSPGAYDAVSVPVDAADPDGDLRAVAVLGTADRVLDPYRHEGTVVSVPVAGAAPSPVESTPTATVTPTATPSPTVPSPTATSSPTPSPTTEGSAPGFGIAAALAALAVSVRIARQ